MIPTSPPKPTVDEPQRTNIDGTRCFVGFKKTPSGDHVLGVLAETEAGVEPVVICQMLVAGALSQERARALSILAIEFVGSCLQAQPAGLRDSPMIATMPEEKLRGNLIVVPGR